MDNNNNFIDEKWHEIKYVQYTDKEGNVIVERYVDGKQVE